MKKVVCSLFLASCLHGALACGPSSTSPTTPTAAPALPPAPDACVGDAPWVVAILGQLPQKSDYISIEHGMRDPQLAPLIANGKARDADGTSGWLKNVSWSSQEVFEYEGQQTQKVIVARNVQGKDPRTLGDFGQPPALGTPRALTSGVLEWPAAQADGKFLYTFADNTWVIVEAWMAPRFRAVFSSSAQSPPLPTVAPDTFIEYCFPRLKAHEIDADKFEGIELVGADHFSLRFHANQGISAEFAITYPTAEQAQRAEASVRQKCAQRPCGLSGSRVDGRVARYQKTSK